MSLAQWLPLTLSGQTPLRPTQRLDSGVTLSWLAPGALRVEPASPGSLHLLLSAGIHGNETAPVEWLDAWLRKVVAGHIVPRNPLLLLLGHPPALRAGTRYIEQDMNRLFNSAHQASSGFEAQRAAQLEQLAKTFFAHARRGLHYDLHTAIRGSRHEKFALYPWHQGRQLPAVEHRRLAAAGMQAVLIHDRPGNTFSAYTHQALGVESFTLELGKARPFGENTALDIKAFDDTVTALAEGREPVTPPQLPPLWRVADSLIKRSDDFQLRLDVDAENFAPLCRGALLAQDGEQRWYVEQDGACIVFPNPTVAAGKRAGLIVVQCA